jgi:hypothetical protein
MRIHSCGWTGSILSTRDFSYEDIYSSDCSCQPSLGCLSISHLSANASSLLTLTAAIVLWVWNPSAGVKSDAEEPDMPVSDRLRPPRALLGFLTQRDLEAAAVPVRTNIGFRLRSAFRLWRADPRFVSPPRIYFCLRPRLASTRHNYE